MGADLLLSIVWTTQEPKAIDFQAIGDAIENLSSEIAATNIQDVASERWDKGDGILDIIALRMQLHEDLEDFRTVWNGEYRREAYSIRIGPLYVAITGGLSWGDSPTEEFDAWNRLIESGVLEAGGLYS